MTPMNVRNLFEEELKKRGLAFSIDANSGRHILDVGGGKMLISLENLERDVSREKDVDLVSRFVNSILTSSSLSDIPFAPEQLFWCFEPNDYKERADFREPLSDCVDRVLVRLSPDGRLITWITARMLESLGMSEFDAKEQAFTNLARTLRESKIETMENGDVQLGFINTPLPFKTALILAPNLKEIVGPILGWPLMAVIPDRNFLYLWAAKHNNFVGRVGHIVVREFSKSPYPISTEVFEITDKEIRAIGAFPTSA
jgi:hypothetical protein